MFRCEYRRDVVVESSDIDTVTYFYLDGDTLIVTPTCPCGHMEH